MEIFQFQNLDRTPARVLITAAVLLSFQLVWDPGSSSALADGDRGRSINENRNPSDNDQFLEDQPSLSEGSEIANDESNEQDRMGFSSRRNDDQANFSSRRNDDQAKFSSRRNDGDSDENLASVDGEHASGVVRFKDSREAYSPVLQRNLLWYLQSGSSAENTPEQEMVSHHSVTKKPVTGAGLDKSDLPQGFSESQQPSMTIAQFHRLAVKPETAKDTRKTKDSPSPADESNAVKRFGPLTRSFVGAARRFKFLDPGPPLPHSSSSLHFWNDFDDSDSDSDSSIERKKVLVAKAILSRRSSLDNNFIRFGRSQLPLRDRQPHRPAPPSSSSSWSSYPYPSPASSPFKNRVMRDLKDNFIRFGRELKDNFIRFGRQSASAAASDTNFIRFGRSLPGSDGDGVHRQSGDA